MCGSCHLVIARSGATKQSRLFRAPRVDCFPRIKSGVAMTAVGSRHLLLRLDSGNAEAGDHLAKFLPSGDVADADLTQMFEIEKG